MCMDWAGAGLRLGSIQRIEFGPHTIPVGATVCVGGAALRLKSTCTLVALVRWLLWQPTDSSEFPALQYLLRFVLPRPLGGGGDPAV